jgi:hypothetical protein
MYVCYCDICMSGSSLNLTQHSNNPFSDAHRNQITNQTKLNMMTKRREVLDRDILPPTDYFKTQFEIENSLDIELYNWAYARFAGTGR